MKILTIAHQKGGVGKTTLAINIACCYQKGGLNVAMLDTDLQGSLSGIANDLEGISMIPAEDISNISSMSYDILIIDTPPYLSDILTDIFMLSDFVLVPTKVSFADIMAIKGTINLLQLVTKSKPHMNFGIVLNMVKPRTALNAEIKEFLEQYHVPILNSTISERVSYIRSFVVSGVFNTDDDRAKEEVSILADEILTKLGV